jgi:hypothetical protein
MPTIPRAASPQCRWTAAVAVGLVLASACAPKTARRQTDIMEQSGKVSVSAAVLRARVNDLVERFAGRIELTADRVSAETNDDGLRRRALVLKIDAIPAVYAAGFRADPLAAAVDVWGFAFQFSHYVESGAGQRAFGPGQPLVQECARDLLAAADAVIKAIAIRPEPFDQARARVEGWARAHPVEYGFSSRASGGALVADLRSDDRDVFLAVGAVSDLLENLSERLNTYAAQRPELARWQAEILIPGIAAALGVEAVAADVHDLGIAARRAADLLSEVPGMLAAQKDLLAGERRAILADVSAQRAQTLEFMTGERLAVLAAAREERMALAAALRQERMETLTELDAIKTRAVESALAGVRDLIDYTLWRIAAFTFCLMFATAALGAIAYRLALGPASRRS